MDTYVGPCVHSSTSSICLKSGANQVPPKECECCRKCIEQKVYIYVEDGLLIEQFRDMDVELQLVEEREERV